MLLLLIFLLVNSWYEQFLISKQELHMQMKSNLHSKMPNGAEFIVVQLISSICVPRPALYLLLLFLLCPEKLTHVNQDLSTPRISGLVLLGWVCWVSEKRERSVGSRSSFILLPTIETNLGCLSRKRQPVLQDSSSSWHWEAFLYPNPSALGLITVLRIIVKNLA